MAKHSPIDYKRLHALASEVSQGANVEDELVNLFYDLARRVLFHVPDLRKVVNEEDALQEAVMNCYTAATSFDPEKSKAATFFVRVIYNRYYILFNFHNRAFRNPKNAIILSLDEILGLDHDWADSPAACRDADKKDLTVLEPDHCVRREALYGRNKRGYKSHLKPEQVTEVFADLDAGHDLQTVASRYKTTVDIIQQMIDWREECGL